MRFLTLEPNATGCPNACRHCNAMGSPPFGELMTLQDMRSVVAQFESVLRSHSPQRPVPVRLDVPFEPTAHPQFLELYEYLIARCPDSATRFSLLNSNGWGVARWENWRDLLGRLKDLGVTGLGTAVHGLAEEHDWFCRRRGAFADLVEAGRRVLACGLDLVLEIHLNTRNLKQIGPLIAHLQGTSDGRVKILWSVSAYYMNDRLRALEALRPTPEDLAPALDKLLAAYDRDLPRTEAEEVAWLSDPESDLGHLCESYEPDRREGGGFGSDLGERSFGDFCVTPEFDVVETFCSRPGLRHGNLKTDGIDRVWERVLNVELPPMPSAAELARRFGGRASRKLYDGGVYVKLCETYWTEAGVAV